MPRTEEAQTQVATRIPKELHRRLKLYCVTHEIALMHFVVEAIEEMLGRKTRRKEGDGVRRAPRLVPPLGRGDDLGVVTERADRPPTELRKSLRAF